MKRCDFIKLSASVALCLMVGLTLLSCSKKSNPVDQVLEESDLRSAVSVPLAQTQTTIEGQLPNDSGNHVGKLITITDGVAVGAFHCGLSWADYECVVSDPAGGASFTSIVSLPDIRTVAVGDQFDIVSQTECNGQYDLTLSPIVQTTIDGQLPNDGGNHVGGLITITDALPSLADHCGLSWAEYQCVVSDPDGGPSLTRIVSLPEILIVAVNDEFVVKTQSICDGQYDLTLTPIVFINVSNKTTLCHIPSGNASNPITIEVSNHAVQAHLNHGDQLGPCL